MEKDEFFSLLEGLRGASVEGTPEIALACVLYQMASAKDPDVKRCIDVGTSYLMMGLEKITKEHPQPNKVPVDLATNILTISIAVRSMADRLKAKRQQADASDSPKPPAETTNIEVERMVNSIMDDLRKGPRS